MNVKEFSNEFDTLYNNLMSNAAPSIDEYEKSILLTKAQEEIIKNHFEPLGNKYQKGLDDSPKRQIDFSGLIKVDEGKLVDTPSTTFDKRAKVYSLPTDTFLVINESVKTDKGTKQIVPISYTEYTRLMSRPYKEPLKYQAWRIQTNSINNVELIVNSNENIEEYLIRYVKRPQPIILINLQDEYGNITINGVSNISECELNSNIHSEILQRAVELAKSTYLGDINTSVELGQRAE